MNEYIARLSEELLSQFEDFAKTQKDARLYFKVQKGAKGCPADKPYGVVGEKSGVVHGCHADPQSAAKHLAAIYRATDPKSGYKPASKETKKDMETPEEHKKRVNSASKGISVGDHVMYAVPKPPQETKYAHGIVKSIVTSGTVKIAGTNESFEATKDDPVAKIEVWSVDEKGNPKSKTDRVVAKPLSKLRLSKTPMKSESAGDRNSTLKNIMMEYNKTAPKDRKVNMTTLKTVFNRGVGAYRTNPSSVRPNVVSAEQWGYGRVRAFLKMLKNGKAPRKPFDQDLLPKKHPLSSKANFEDDWVYDETID